MQIERSAGEVGAARRGGGTVSPEQRSAQPTPASPARVGGGGRGGAWGRLAPARRSCIIQQLHFRPASFLGVGVCSKLCLWDSPGAAAAALVYVFSVASSHSASARGRLRGCKRKSLRLLGIRSGSASRGRVPARQFRRRPGLASPRAQVAPAAPRTLSALRRPDSWGRRWAYWSGEAATGSGAGTFDLGPRLLAQGSFSAAGKLHNLGGQGRPLPHRLVPGPIPNCLCAVSVLPQDNSPCPRLALKGRPDFSFFL